MPLVSGLNLSTYAQRDKQVLHCRKVKSMGVNKEGGVPDGMCLDHEGRIWTAICGGSAVVCLDPETGNELHRLVDLFARQATHLKMLGMYIVHHVAMHLSNMQLSLGQGVSALFLHLSGMLCN